MGLALSLPVSQLIQFDAFEVDLRAGELRKHGIKIRVQQQPFLILQTLLETGGQVVTSEELQKKIWPEDTFVDFDHGLHAAINKVRQALGDAADNPRYIETVGRKGYRFIGHIQGEAVQEPTPMSDTATTIPLPTHGRALWNSWTGVLTGIVIAVAFASTLVFFNVGGLRSWFYHPRFRSLAVLPLNNLTSDPGKDYFADGMTEDLITQLSKLGDLKVISHTSVLQYKGSHKPLPQIARELNVDAVVEGAVQLDKDRVRITAQLVDGSTDQHIWAETYDRELSNVLLLQSDVARDIARQISEGSKRIFGVMVESHLLPGAQKFSAGKDDPGKLAYGLSITDACLGWDDSVRTLERLSAAVAARRSAHGTTPAAVPA